MLLSFYLGLGAVYPDIPIAETLPQILLCLDGSCEFLSSVDVALGTRGSCYVDWLGLTGTRLL
jgi:hypothetical protein